MEKRAVVLAGGGSRGSYQMGVWRALRELGWEFQIVTGTSIGALNGALMVQDDYDVGMQMWENISTAEAFNLDLDAKPSSLRDMGSKVGTFLSEMKRNGGVDTRPLEEIVARCVDEERIRNSPIDFAIVTVAYPTLEPRIVDKESLPEGELVDYLMASAACFPAMKMRQIGEEKFIDGGYYDNLPINLALERGAQEIVAVDLEAVGRKRKIVIKGMARKRPVTEKGAKIHYIRSKWNLGAFLLFDQDVARRNIQLGYLDTLKAFDRLEGNAYTFYKGETEQNARALEKYFDLTTVKTNLTVRKYTRGDQEPNANVRLARITSRAVPQLATCGAIAAAAETAARVFGVSPEEVYHVDELNQRLLEDAENISQSEREVLAAMVERLTPKGVLEAVRRIDRRSIAVFCRNEIRKVYAGEDRSTIIKALGRLASDELVAGIYLFVLELAGRLCDNIAQLPV